MRSRLQNLTFLLLLSTICMHSIAQDSAILKWSVQSTKLEEGKYRLHFTAPANKSWQVYAAGQIISGIPTTELKFADSSVQPGQWQVAGAVQKIDSKLFESEVQLQEEDLDWTTTITIAGKVPAQLQGDLSFSYGRNEEFYQQTFSFSVALEGGLEASTVIKVPSIDVNKPVNDCGDEGTTHKSLFAIFLLGLGGGLIALLTPCVFPMIPVTVTFFTKKSQSKRAGIRNGVLYGLFIFLIYLAITIPFHIGNQTPEILNNISTNAVLNLVFFAIFLLFALSFFGLFELTLPSSFANKMDSKSGLGNIGGIFFMAATLAIVSFSCTGPILGTLLVGVSSEGAWPLTAGAAGFGVALGLPFALFAIFPNWLQSLPKSGGWMTDVKIVLGFVELALAIKFLSNADLVNQWGLLKREIFIGLWLLIALLCALYLCGILKFKHSTPLKRYSAIRIAFITVFFSMAVYLGLGLFLPGRFSMSLFSGFPPPRTYSIVPTTVKVFKPMHNAYEEALVRARKEHKPILIDFTGWACVNCRRMEENVWPDPIVDSLMRTRFVVVSLYVDERKNLPLTEQVKVTLANGSSRQIVTVGDKWSTFQTENFGATAQPQYAIINADQVALTRTKFYTPSADAFIKWLQCGLDAFEKR